MTTTMHNRTTLPHRFDVVVLHTDGTALTYHVPSYSELVQSLVDMSPIAGTYVCAVGVSLGGQALSSRFTARALLATGIGRLKALKVMGTDAEAATDRYEHAWVWGEGLRPYPGTPAEQGA